MSRKRLLLLVAGVLIVGAAIFGLSRAVPFVRYSIAVYRHNQVAALHEPEAQQAWRRDFGDPDKTIEAYPTHGDSDSAVQTVALARPLGIEMAIPHRDKADPDKHVDPLRTVWKAVNDYMFSELTKVGGPVALPPEAVRTYLDANRVNLDSIVSHLAKSEDLAWKTDIASLGLSASAPNLLGELHLQKVLIARCLSGFSRREDYGVDRYLRASWNLNASLRDRPEVISQLIAVTVFRMQLGLARRIPVDPSAWSRRFAQHDFRGSMLRAMEVEAVAGLRVLPQSASTWDRATRADYLDTKRDFLTRLRSAPVSDRPAPAVPATASDENPLSAGAIVATMALANLADIVQRVDRTMVDLELTELVLKAHQEKASFGHWPDAIPNSRSSRIADASWIYSVSPGGRLTIALSRELRWTHASGLVLPLRYESD
jgi:hypothetical protein